MFLERLNWPDGLTPRQLPENGPETGKWTNGGEKKSGEGICIAGKASEGEDVGWGYPRNAFGVETGGT